MPTTIGILGGGQLARMLALAGHPLDLRFVVLDPAPDAPAACVATHIAAEYTDKAALNHFASGLDAITYEFENVPPQTIEHLASHVHEKIPIWPPPQALKTGQDRLFEKQLFQSLSIPVARFEDIASLDDLRSRLPAIGLPAVLKTRRLGYDGKGQAIIRSSAPDQLESAYRALSPTGTTPLILEEFIPFQAEGSIIAVRSRHGEIRVYPFIRNEHASGILRRSLAPFGPWPSDPPIPLDPLDLHRQAVTAATRILNELAYVGVLACEFFIKDGLLIANEIAPRVHNSGHWTIEGSVTSQFENHIRAVAGLPLGDTSMRYPGASAYMCNLIGGWPDPTHPAGILSIPSAHLHLYGKTPRPGRKVGHATLVASSGLLAPPAAALQSLADSTWRPA